MRNRKPVKASAERKMGAVMTRWHWSLWRSRTRMSGVAEGDGCWPRRRNHVLMQSGLVFEYMVAVLVSILPSTTPREVWY